ncbi:MAG: lysostaphin resistance A-like protein [Thermoleophilia bacterium]
MTTLDHAPGAPGAAPPGFWWRVLTPPGSVLATFAAIVVAFGILDQMPLSEDSIGAIIAFASSAMMLVLGILILQRLPAHERRLAVARPQDPLRTILVGAGAGLVLLVVALLIVAAGAALDPGVQDRLDDVEEIGTAPWQLVLAALALVVLAPLGEELLFRALLLRGLVRRMAFVWAALISATAFAAVHIDAYLLWPRLISLLVTGLGLAWVYRRRGYWGAVAAHATVNVIATISLIATSL